MTSTLFVCLVLGVALSYGAVYEETCPNVDMAHEEIYYPGGCVRCSCNSGYIKKNEFGVFIKHRFAECHSCGSVYADPKRCYLVTDETAKYPDCCPQIVCRGDEGFDQKVFKQKNPDHEDD